MHQRCYNPENQAFKNYGGRGIMVAPPWHSFAVFEEDMGERPKGKTLDRKDNNGNYCKSNCRWASHGQQARNRRSNVLITIGDEAMCVADWAERTGLNPQTIYSRLNAGWVPAAAVLSRGGPRPDLPHNPRSPIDITIGGATRNVAQWCKTNGVPVGTAYARIRRGWDPKRAVTTPV